MAEIFEEREPWGRPLAVSATLHAALFAGVFAYAAIAGGAHPENWGGLAGKGGAMNATLVSSIPLPAQEAENVVANPSAGLSQSLPKPIEQPKPEAIPMAEPEPKKKPPPKPRPASETETAAVENTNLVPFGQGGPVSGPFGVFSAGGARGGFNVTGGGDFGSRFGWYVDVVRRKVSENWLKYEIDPGIVSARRVYITFDIRRNGEPANVQLSQSSGVPSLDQSALRALQRIDTFGPLPPDYGGSKVSVEFWFDYRR